MLADRHLFGPSARSRCVQNDDGVVQIDYAASQHLRDVINSLGRTEDVKFSPNNQRLAVAGFSKNKITVFEISISVSRKSKDIKITGAAEISSSYLKGPHGLDFLDNETIIAANREGQACIFKLPSDAAGSLELAPLAVVRSDLIATPGSVAIVRKEQGLYEALICNNYRHTVTRHLLDLTAGCSTKNNEILFKKWIDVPDSISLSEDKQWIAVSNHNTHTVLLYHNNRPLNESSDPDGILRGTYYPHGLRFTSDGRFIFVADADLPYVNIYENNDADWRGVHNPRASFRVLNNEDYLSGEDHAGERGPKGIDINSAMNVFVTTCKAQPLAFFDLTSALESASARSDLRKRRALEVNYELDLQDEADGKILFFKNSKSWRITAPFRSMFSILSAFRDTRRAGGKDPWTVL